MARPVAFGLYADALHEKMSHAPAVPTKFDEEDRA